MSSSSKTPEKIFALTVFISGHRHNVLFPPTLMWGGTMHTTHAVSNITYPELATFIYWAHYDNMYWRILSPKSLVRLRVAASSLLDVSTDIAWYLANWNCFTIHNVNWATVCWSGWCRTKPVSTGTKCVPSSARLARQLYIFSASHSIQIVHYSP